MIYGLSAGRIFVDDVMKEAYNMLTLEQAIQHAHEVACAGGVYAFEHKQLVGWLEELQSRREADAALTAGLYAVMSDWEARKGGKVK